MRYIFTLLLFCAISMVANAQTELTDSVVVEEFVTIYKDPRLDILDKRPALLAKIEATEKAETKAKEIPLYKPIVSADGKKQVTGSIYTLKGYRIVIYNGADKNAALAAKNNFSRAFPGTRSYLSYNVPSYKIKVGDFDDKNDATKFMRRLSAAFPSCFIVPDLVTIKNISVSQ
jgi:hypothetical protein